MLNSLQFALHLDDLVSLGQFREQVKDFYSDECVLLDYNGYSVSCMYILCIFCAFCI